MKVLRRADGRRLLVFRKGEKVVATILDWVAREGIRSGAVSGLGSVRNAELGYFDLGKKEYLKRTFPGDMEVLGLTGNLSRLGEKPVLHAHVTISGTDFAAVGGHLFEAEVAITLELEVFAGAETVLRGPDEETGLNLLQV